MVEGHDGVGGGPGGVGEIQLLYTSIFKFVSGEAEMSGV